MKSGGKWFVGVVAFGALTLVPLYLLRERHNAAARAELLRELDQMRREGLCTTWREFSDSIASAKPQENAAAFYRTLKKRIHLPNEIKHIEVGLVMDRTPADLDAAKSCLAAHSEELRTIDQAAQKPRCWFDRDWSKGAAVLLPEYADMKAAAKLVALRGSVAAYEGRSEDAIRAAREIETIANHAGEEQTPIATLVAWSIRDLAASHLALWAMATPNRRAYREELVAEASEWPKPNVQRMHRDSYVLLISTLHLSITQEGRRDLGVKEADVPMAEKIIPRFAGGPQADLVIARGSLHEWEAYGKPPDKREVLLSAASQEMSSTLMAYPLGWQIYSMLSMDADGEPVVYRADDFCELGRRLWLAVARGLDSPTIKTAISTTGLTSPYDGSPIRYRYDGHQIQVEGNFPTSDKKTRKLSVPPDSEIVRAKGTASD